MARGTGGPLDPDKLMEEYRLYDRAVDVVSIYHWLFTESRELASTVAHFERYPKIKAPDGTVSTPDFTVLFHDGRGIAAEIANIALHEGSIESLCQQLDKYSRLTSLPTATGDLGPVTELDVLFLTPIDNATAAVRRVFSERLDNPEHWFKPARRPVAIQFAASPENYVIQFWPDRSVNGSLAPGTSANYGDFDDLKVRPEYFGENKIKHAFMNDPVKPLYLATRLWTSIFPSRFGTSGQFEVTTHEITKVVQDQYGLIRSNDVKSAMAILRAAGLAVEVGERWRVRRRSLRLLGDDVHVAIARLADRRPTSTQSRRRVEVSGPVLFELDEDSGSMLA